MQMKKRIVGTIFGLSSLVFLYSALLWGQSATGVHGRVTDPDGGAVPRAMVRLYSRGGGATITTRSDENGAYRLEAVAPGEYLLEAEDQSSMLAVSEGILIWPGDDLNHNIELKIRSLRTEVLVTASSTPLPLDEVAKAADVVDGSQISRRAEFSLAEAIRNVPGVRVQQNSGPGSFTTIQSRGLRNQDTAVLIDGLRFRDAASIGGDATAFFQDMLIVNVDRIEIVRGSGASLYGTNAMGGVINVVTEQGGGKTHGEVSVEGGQLGMLRGAARIGGGIGDLDSFVYSGGITHLNVTEGVDGFDPYRNTSGQGFAKYNFVPNVSLSGRVWASGAFAALNESPTFTDAILANHPAGGVIPAIGLSDQERERFERGEPFSPGNATFIPAYNDPDNHRAASFFSGAVIFNHRLSPNSSYVISYHGVDTNRAFRDGPAGQGSFDPIFSNESLFNGRIDTIQLRTDNRIGKFNLVTVGYEFEREEHVNATTDENPDPALRPISGIELKQRSHALFVQDQIRLADGRLQIALSGRMQSFDLDTPRFTGNANPYADVSLESPPAAYTGDAAVAYFFRSTGTKLRAHIGNAYRVPSAFNRFGGFFSSFSNSFSFFGDPRLSPERSIAFDAGIDQWLFNSKLRLSSTFFYTSLQEIILFDFGVIDASTDPFGRFGGYRNGGGGLARGVEFSLSVAPASATSFNFSYTYTNSDSRTPTVPGTDFFKVLGQSDHMFTLTATQRVGRRFDVAFDLFAVSDYSQRLFGADGRFVFDGPVKADVVASYTVPVANGHQMKFYGKVENVFDNNYFEGGFNAPGIWAIGGVKFSF
ncbi:MAG: TonB-dependent receptor [Acidobacteria bacterium]|nr:TonB-dependent receptor [Acidobacteriota bacterium]